jgi:hypothetical protein
VSGQLAMFGVDTAPANPAIGLPVTNRGAVLDRTLVYRYRLWRHWEPSLGCVLWVMLNPSTATADIDDATIRRCMGFARSWGYGGIEVVNLFALRSTSPSLLYSHPEPIGEANDAHIREALHTAKRIVAAWGAHGKHLDRAAAVMAMVAEAGKTVECLGITVNGHPMHPVRLAGDTPLRTFVPRDQPVYLPATDEELAAIAALSPRRVTYPPASSQKRFAGEIQGALALTDRQREYIWLLVHRFRRQLPPAIVALGVSRVPQKVRP